MDSEDRYFLSRRLSELNRVFTGPPDYAYRDSTLEEKFEELVRILDELIDSV